MHEFHLVYGCTSFTYFIDARVSLILYAVAVVATVVFGFGFRAHVVHGRKVLCVRKFLKDCIQPRPSWVQICEVHTKVNVHAEGAKPVDIIVAQ